MTNVEDMETVATSPDREPVPAGVQSSIEFLDRDARQLDIVPAGELVADRFVVDHLAAVGGMSVVYRALDLSTQQRVAIKVLNKRDPITDQRFATEAAILSTLSHPSIVGYIAHGLTRHKSLFLAMEWLSGKDLASHLAGSGLRASESLALMRQLCAGLALAHEHGVLHRDIKPSNIFLAGDSVHCAKLLDFGVARRDATTNTLTKAGALLGTVGYMAPEQARGAVELDQRADVFALGCVLYECLTGQPAFSGAHDLAVLAKVLRGEPQAVSAARPDLGPEFDALLERLLAKDRTQRPASAREALAEIEATYASGAVRDDAAAHARTSYSEQRISSVIVGQPQREPLSVPAVVPLDELARDFDAEIVPMQGGALLVILTAGAHSTATDQAARAARCVLRLALKRPDLSLGLATGSVDTTSNVPMGVAIDRAAALIDADLGTVKLDSLTASLLGARFNIRKSSTGLVLESERDDLEGIDVLMGRSTPFVGRAKELAILHAGLRESIADDVPRGFLVTGVPGAGKSRLGREFAERARLDQSARILFARSDVTSAGSPFSLVQSLLRNAAELRVGTPSDAQRDALASYLRVSVGEQDEQLLDFLSEILGVGASTPARALQRAARGDPEVMREQKRRAFARWLALEAARGPLILFLEDLHWGDLPSINFVLQSMRSLSTRALFVLATARPEIHSQFPKLCELTEFEEIALKGLTRKASEQLARTMLPTDTPDSIIGKVVSLAGGNAFYLEELVRRVAEGGGTELPETVLAMAQSRIERLPPEARRVLRAASIFGETAWTGGIDSLLASSSDNDALLGWLIEQEILQPRADARFPEEREYGFRHALLREASYAMLTDVDRRSGHMRAGEWLESRGERDARMLADHFERGGAIARAVPWIARASMDALDGGDFENAIGLSRRGTSLGAYGYQRGMLLMVRAYASTWKCDPELPGEALSLLPRASAPWWLALSLHVFGSSVLGTPEVAEPYLQLALTTSPDTELTSAYGHALHVLATGAALLGHASIGWALVRHFESASEPRQTQLDPVFLAWFNLAKCILASNSLIDGQHWALGQALAWGQASIDAMRVLGSGSGEAAALFHCGNAYWLAGSFDRALNMLQRARKLAKQTGNLLVEEHADILLAVAAMRDGSRADAVATLTNLTASSNLQVSHAAATVLADSYCRDGHLTEAIARAQQATHGSSLMYRRVARAILARAHLARGAHAEALAATDQAFADGSAESFPHLTVDLLGLRASALLGSGARSEAERLVARATSFRADVARTIEDPESRHVFKTRGRANRVLDHLSAALIQRPEESGR